MSAGECRQMVEAAALLAFLTKAAIEIEHKLLSFGNIVGSLS